jgi:hypoxia up-regulated 1
MRGLVSVILLLAATAPSALAALLAVDYGAEWTKASLVKPGTPFDVLLDKGTARELERYGFVY